MLKCAKCGAEQSDNAKFCNACGALMNTDKQCPECKALQPYDARFCNQCGYRFVMTPVEKSAIDPTSLGKIALSVTEKIVLEKAVKDMYVNCNTHEAYNQLKKLYMLHPNSAEVLSEFLPVCAKANPEEAKNIAEKLDIDIPEKYIALFIINMDEDNVVLAENYLQTASEKFTGTAVELLNSCRLKLCEYIADKYGDEKSFDTAQQLRAALESSQDVKVQYLLNNTDKNIEEANRLLFGDGFSCIATAYNVMPNLVRKENIEKAFELYAKADKRNNAVAKYMLAICCYYGWGCTKSLKKAVEYVESALSTASGAMLLENAKKLHDDLSEILDGKGRALLYSLENKTATVEFVRKLLDDGADVNVKNSEGKTPLHFCKDSEIAKLLMERGADVKAKSNNGDTPLHRCNSISMVERLLEHGAGINVRNNEGKTPLDCCRQPVIREILIEHGGVDNGLLSSVFRTLGDRVDETFSYFSDKRKSKRNDRNDLNTISKMSEF